jgi:hypothetical protein
MLRSGSRSHKVIIMLLYCAGVLMIAGERSARNDAPELTLIAIGAALLAGELVLAYLLRPMPPVVHSDE